MMFWLITSVVVLGGGGWALWYWSEPIGEWISSWNVSPEPEPAADEDTPEPAPVDPAPSEPEPTPKDSDTPPTETPPVVESPVDPTAGKLPVEPVPESKPASVAVASTTVRGKVSSAAVGSRLSTIDEALESCWKTAAAKPETQRPATLTLSFGIKWNGRMLSSSIDGDAPAAVEACVREALPGRGWPQPRDGGDASVVRSWTLE